MRPRIWLVRSMLGLTLGCGAGEPGAGTIAGSEPPETIISYYADTCPKFESYTLDPKHVTVGTPIRVNVVATDPEGGDIFYYFSARAGRITDDVGPRAVFHCDAAGPAVISVLAFDPQGCDRVLDIYVSCDEA